MIVSEFIGSFGYDGLRVVADGIGHADVRNESGAEERFFPCESPVDELVDEYEVAGFVFFSERSNGRERDNTIDPGPF